MHDTIAVIGGGTAGRGIARALAHVGSDVLLFEASDHRLAWSLEQLREGMDRDIARWSITEAERDAVLARISGRVSLDSVQDLGLVVEAIQENRRDKEALLAELDRRCAPGTVLVTNTSTLSVTALAETLTPPRRPWLVGLHFLHPVTRIPAVELVRGRETGAEAVAAAAPCRRVVRWIPRWASPPSKDS
jgi:3-hydroxybutyryl-CoA dehydrogenase